MKRRRCAERERERGDEGAGRAVWSWRAVAIRSRERKQVDNSCAVHRLPLCAPVVSAVEPHASLRPRRESGRATCVSACPSSARSIGMPLCVPVVCAVERHASLRPRRERGRAACLPACPSCARSSCRPSSPCALSCSLTRPWPTVPRRASTTRRPPASSTSSASRRCTRSTSAPGMASCTSTGATSTRPLSRRCVAGHGASLRWHAGPDRAPALRWCIRRAGPRTCRP